MTGTADLQLVADAKLGAAFSVAGSEGLQVQEERLREAARDWGLQEDVLRLYRRWR